MKLQMWRVALSSLSPRCSSASNGGGRHFSESRAKHTLRRLSLSQLELGNSTELTELRKACEEDGFFYLTEHGVSNRVLDSCLRAAGRFFSLPVSAKNEVHGSLTQVYPGTTGLPVRGYVGLKEERLGAYPGDTVEHKEAFDWAADLPALGAQTPFHGPNLWPSSLQQADFREPMEAFRDQLLSVGLRLLRQTSIVRGLRPDALDDVFSQPTFVCRTLQYSPSSEEQQMGCNPHTDNGFITLLHQDSVGGLQAKLQGSEWVDVPPLPGALVINIGDTLAAHTAGRWRSTVHRVLPSPDSARLSAAFFLDPNASMKMLPDDTRAGETKEAIKVLLHKAGLAQDDLDSLRHMSFAEYKVQVFSKFAPDSSPHDDFTDVKHGQQLP